MTETWADLGGQPSTATPPTLLRGCGKTPCLGHPDGHSCPWLDETTPAGRAIPCPCTHQAAEKGGRG